MSLESTTILILEDNNLHKSTLKITLFKKKKDQIYLRLYPLRQRLVTLINTSFKPILYSLRKFEMRTNQRINKLKETQKRQKCYSKMLEK